MPTISQIEIGGTVYDIKDATVRDHRPYISSLKVEDRTDGVAGNNNQRTFGPVEENGTVKSTVFSPFYCYTIPSKSPYFALEDSNYSILSINGVEFRRSQSSVNIWTEVFLESRYFDSHASTTTTLIGMQERRTCPQNTTSRHYNLNLVDNLKTDSADTSAWRPIAYSGQDYSILVMRTTLLIFGSKDPSRYALRETTARTWTQLL